MKLSKSLNNEAWRNKMHVRKTSPLQFESVSLPFWVKKKLIVARSRIHWNMTLSAFKIWSLWNLIFFSKQLLNSARWWNRALPTVFGSYQEHVIWKFLINLKRHRANSIIGYNSFLSCPQPLWPGSKISLETCRRFLSGERNKNWSTRMRIQEKQGPYLAPTCSSCIQKMPQELQGSEELLLLFNSMYSLWRR